MRLLRLYPRRWRDRYGPEMCALLEEHHVQLRTLADLVAGAVRARLEAKEDKAMARVRPVPMRCSFCGKRPDQVSRLVAGPGVYICDRCVQLCNEVIANEGPRCDPPPPPAPPASTHRGTPDVPSLFRTWLRNVFRSSEPAGGLRPAGQLLLDRPDDVL